MNRATPAQIDMALKARALVDRGRPGQAVTLLESIPPDQRKGCTADIYWEAKARTNLPLTPDESLTARVAYTAGNMLFDDGFHSACLRITEIASESPDLLYLRGITLSLLGRYDEAIEILTHLLDSEGEKVDTITALANALRRAGRYEESLPHYLRAEELESWHPDKFNNHGISLIALGRFSEAVDVLMHAISEHPYDSLFYENLVEAANGCGKGELAKWALAKQKQMTHEESII